jgi:uncharacterized protein (DUF39 family)
LQATVAQYTKNMEALVGKLKATGARLIFATTTPVAPGTINPLRETDAPQRYNAAANSGSRVLHTYMGKLLPGCGNVNFSGAGELSPLINDPDYSTIGIGTRIFLGGGIGYITGSGTQHNPGAQFGTLMVQGDLKGMSAEFLKAALFHGYGSSMYIGIGIPIPVLNAEIAKNTGISDREIETNIIDYSVASRTRPVLEVVGFEEANQLQHHGTGRGDFVWGIVRTGVYHRGWITCSSKKEAATISRRTGGPAGES